MKHLLLLFSGLALAASPAFASPAERELEAKLQHQLDAIVGPGKAHVSVSGRSSDGYQSRSLNYSHQQPVSERKNSETHSSTSSGQDKSTGTQSTTRSQSQGVYTYDRSEELRTHAPDPLSQRSVSVVFEPPSARNNEGEESVDNGHPVDKALVEDVVRSAAGIDESRGDRLNVQESHIDTSAFDRLKDEMMKQKQGPAWWIFALIGLIGIGFGTMIGLLIRRRRSAAQPAPDWQQMNPQMNNGQPYPPAYPQAQAPNPLEAGPQGPVIQIRPGQ